MKKNLEAVKHYARSLSEEQLEFLCDRLEQKFSTDLVDGLQIMQESADIDRWLASARSSKEFFEMIDVVKYILESEIKRRSKTAT